MPCGIKMGRCEAPPHLFARQMTRPTLAAVQRTAPFLRQIKQQNPSVVQCTG